MPYREGAFGDIKTGRIHADGRSKNGWEWNFRRDCLYDSIIEAAGKTKNDVDFEMGKGPTGTMIMGIRFKQEGKKLKAAE